MPSRRRRKRPSRTSPDVQSEDSRTFSLLLLEISAGGPKRPLSAVLENLQRLVPWRSPPDEPGPSTRPTVAQDFTMLQIRGGDKFLSVVKPLEANLHVGIPVGGAKSRVSSSEPIP